MRYYASYQSPLGNMLIVATDTALTGLYFTGQKYFPRVDPTWREDAAVAPIRATLAQLDDYFAGRRTQFDVLLAPFGTSYQHAIWNAIATVPYGKTITYGELATRAGYAGGLEKKSALLALEAGQQQKPLIEPDHENRSRAAVIR